MELQGIATSDFKGLNDLKVQAKLNQKQALPEVAKQFEGIFLQSMLKSMRMGQHFLDDSSPFSSQKQATFQEMLDGQYASNIANSPHGIGLAAMMTKQLKNSVENNVSQPLEMMPSNDVKNTTSLKQPLAANAPVNTSGNTSSGEAEGIDNFVKAIWPKAKEAASVIGLDPKILIAQAALETGWGKFVAKDSDGSSSNNLFNIKTGNNKDFESVAVKTTEYIADTPINKTESFRKYSSVEQSFNDYVSLIMNNERYQGAVANAGNPELFVNELHKAGYATDPKYSNKILAIYHGDDLNRAMQRCGIAEQI
ncbi:flagellar assembly peptidoglycan hydrolase FlgJ [Legionella fallonii]|uniref:Peptidoglycan hydrolase FlgJ n=1 Tax=Legionella fallonii LLAP-10 TaxID=1212491 RepID=A0A098G2B1_9GAMM|nr:flagellar assembly peptidoglycan hydrolase FlgJ [Legionella fallonii]CEG56613.1 Flagellar biosynthesis protein FlgJ [Legionella fallonii LLAP-10]